MIGERLADDVDPAARFGHEFRYRLAAGYLEPGDRVLDAACGTGYGRDILTGHGDVLYTGVDREPVARPGRFIQADLTDWTPAFEFDVFVGFETIEHLADPGHYLDIARQARRTILLSVPVVPTAHTNPFHLRDYAPGELATMVARDGWRLVQQVGQPSELAEIYVFSR